MRTILSLISIFFSFVCAAQMRVIELQDMDVKTLSNRPAKRVSIAGKTFEKGVWILDDYSNNHIRLGGSKGRFSALVGVDDSAHLEFHPTFREIPSTDTIVTVEFYVFTNKGVAFRSGLMKKGDAPKTVDIDLKGITDLYFAMESSGAIPWPINYISLVEAKFTVPKPPVVVDKNAVEERYILTPLPPPAPRINGAKIVGASQGKPFLFTIATTGTRPVTFTAKGLPKGLILDKAKGVITGACSEAGRFPVAVTATNRFGVCHETIEIVIGEGLALTPHMGWNSWYSFYRHLVTQEKIEQNAQAMYDEGLVNFGYTYVNTDGGWGIKTAASFRDDPIVGGPLRNPDGTLRSNGNFPDMKRLTAYIHNLGFKAGTYSSPGPADCAGTVGFLGHEAQGIKTISDWGFDFLKYDLCSYRRLLVSGTVEELQKPYRLISQEIKKADRDIVLAMCQYGMGDSWKWGKEVGGNSWRTTGDIDSRAKVLTRSMYSIGFFQNEIREYTGPGGWNDPDFLIFGTIYDRDRDTEEVRPTSFTPSEHYTQMTLWSMAAAPLILGGDMTKLDDFTKNILCNAEVIAVDQDKLGKAGGRIYRRDMIEILKKELSDGCTAIAIFNKRPLETTVNINWKELGYSSSHHVRDLWRQINLGNTSEVQSFDIPRHGCVLLKIADAECDCIK